MDVIKWDGTFGIDHEYMVKEALIGECGYITAEEKAKALSMSYGDFGELLKKKHGIRYQGGTRGDYLVDGNPKTVKVSITELNVAYEMTWNKAAKAIHRWLKEGNENKMIVSEYTSAGVNEPPADNYIKAVSVNRNIIANAHTAQMSLYEVCKGLKEMRDGKLYKELGYKNFEEYCKQEVGFDRRQAYRMITVVENLPEDFVTSMSQIGSTKLNLLCDLSEEERTEITENNDLESISVRELKAEIEKLKKENNTVSMKLAEINSENIRVARQRNEAYDKVHELEEEIKELENRPVDVTYSDADSHEIENMRRAMEKMSDEWRDKYDDLQESSIKREVEQNMAHNDEMDKLRAEYEEKLKAAQSNVVEKADIIALYAPYRAFLNRIWSELEFFIRCQKGADSDYCIKETVAVLQKMLTKLEKWEEY